MFLTFDHVYLVEDHSNRRHRDVVVYLREGGIIGYDLTLWPNVKAQGEGFLAPEDASEIVLPFREYKHTFKRYGTLYVDSSENWCIVPDVWNESHAGLAQMAIRKAA